VIPQFLQDGVGIRPGEGAEPGSFNYTFFGSTCRFAVAARKFALHDGAETEVPVISANSTPAAERVREMIRIAKEKAKEKAQYLEAPPRIPDPAVKVDENKIVIDTKVLDPDRVGTVEMGIRFVSSEPTLPFSGLMWFGPSNFSLYIGDAASDLSIETWRNIATKAYEVDIKNANARMRFSIRKEVYVGESWIDEFDE
jgi:hypothetical protein